MSPPYISYYYGDDGDDGDDGDYIGKTKSCKDLCICDQVRLQQQSVWPRLNHPSGKKWTKDWHWCTRLL